MNQHQAAREIVEGALLEVLQREPNFNEALYAQAVRWLETRYGTVWASEAGRNAYNWVVVQYKIVQRLGLTPPYPIFIRDNLGFLHSDSHPNSDGSNTKCVVYFRIYPSDIGAAIGLVEQMYMRRPQVLRAAHDGDVYAVSAAMYDTNYYQGYGHNREERISNHHRAVLGAINTFRKAITDAIPGTSGMDTTTRRGDVSSNVKVWQVWRTTWMENEFKRDFSGEYTRQYVKPCESKRVKTNSIVVDGVLGQMMEFATQACQEQCGLKPDGIVGPKTWKLIAQTKANV
jgi:peptidoglycan hydrolase-like protein with peptidoglycan-binding domain